MMTWLRAFAGMGVIPVLLLGAAMAQAEDKAPLKSLLFDPAEVATLTKAIADYERSKIAGAPVIEDKEAPPPSVPNIYLSGMAYFGQGQWTVWANGYRIAPNRQAPNFTVVAVNDSEVEIAVGGSDPARFKLRPYQTWRSRSRDVVEGIVP